MHQNDVIHKGIEEIWRKQAYNHREADRADQEKKEKQEKLRKEKAAKKDNNG